MKEIKKEDIFKKINEDIDSFKPSRVKRDAEVTERRDFEDMSDFDSLFNDDVTENKADALSLDDIVKEASETDDTQKDAESESKSVPAKACTTSSDAVVSKPRMVPPSPARSKVRDEVRSPDVSAKESARDAGKASVSADKPVIKTEPDVRKKTSAPAVEKSEDDGSPSGRINKKILILPIAAVLVTIIIVCTAFMFGEKNNDTNAKDADVNVAATAQTEDGVFVQEMRGVWVASVGNLNYPSSKGLGSDALAAEIDSILKECSDVGFNTVFFQVRPAADSLYDSDIFPWSETLSGAQGIAPANKFDPLKYMLSKAPEYGIKVHAWVNPFRVTTGTAKNPVHDVNTLYQDHPARRNSEYVIPYADGKLYFDPGNPEVRKLVIDGIAELCEKYPELAGIHIDDYFYPYPVSGAVFDDSASYEKYGAGLDRDNWRRNNVNLFVKEAYHTVKSSNKDMKFGVAPFGIWANSGSNTPVDGSVSGGMESYFSLYCDTLAWVNGGYVDYIAPQDYWSFSTSAAPFDNIARWWNANLDGSGVDLYIGHAAYKAADYADNEIAVQMEFARNLVSYRGSLFYGYDDIKKNTGGVRDSIKRSFSASDKIKLPVSNSAKISINYPTSNVTTAEKGYIFGVSDPAKPLTVNGERVSRTRDGYFTIYDSFANGDNVYEMKSGNDTLVYTLKRSSKLPTTASASVPLMKKYEIESVTPDKPLWLVPGDKVVINCVAPAGSKVTAKFGEYTVDLKPTVYAANTSTDYRETYTGSITVNKIHAKTGEMADIGVLTVYAEKNGRTAEKTASSVKQMGEDVKICAHVKNDYSMFKRTTVSSFYGDPLPQSVGMRDYITAYVNGYYKLRCGYYISDEDVNVMYDKKLFENMLLGATVNTDIADNSNNLKNSTDIRFSVLENVPVNAYIENGVIKIIFYNTDTSSLPEVLISANPMIAAGKGYVQNGNPVYEFTLKSAENYYGYNVVYENGFIVLKLNNPQSVKDDDKPLAGKTIVVDAGHGGKDIGAQGPSSINSKLHEADLNLSIALELKTELEARGAKVVMIRDDDSTVALDERVEFLSNIIPDLMISIHHNSVDNTVNASKARGFHGLYADDAGVLLANAVSDTVTSKLSRYQRKTAYQALAVARNHRFPSTLCEMSFISYPEEFQWTITPGNYKRSAEALADGVIEFYSRQAKYISY